MKRLRSPSSEQVPVKALPPATQASWCQRKGAVPAPAGHTAGEDGISTEDPGKPASPPPPVRHVRGPRGQHTTVYTEFLTCITIPWRPNWCGSLENENVGPLFDLTERQGKGAVEGMQYEAFPFKIFYYLYAIYSRKDSDTWVTT